MNVRYGYFDGTIVPGREKAFYAYVTDTMMAVWQAFPGLERLEVLKGHSAELDRAYPLITVFAFADRPTLEAALVSPERHRSLEATKGLLEMFDGKIVHVVTEPRGL